MRVRVLVTGSNGLLGTTVLERLLRADGAAEPLAASRGESTNRYLGAFPFWRLDVTDRAAVERVLDEARPNAVVHTAAMTDVDDAERRRDEAWAINADGTANVARACAARGVHLVYLSTEYVFDGEDGPYAEDAPTNPLGWYARTKRAGELAVAAAGGSWTVARSTVLYGYAPHLRPNFVLWLLRQLRAGEVVPVVHDQVGSPTLADNLAEMVLALATSRARGVYNTVGATILSRYDFARLAAETFELDPDLVAPISTASLAQPAPRPLRAGLKMDRFRAAFPDVPILSAGEGLARLRDQLRAADAF
jgi:dTDP-4-dehydrorhamnose reductase